LKRPLQTSSSSRRDRWLLENRETISAQIRRGIEQLDRGEGIPDNELEAHLAKLKAKRE
jgi:predicted transcriptional regulator